MSGQPVFFGIIAVLVLAVLAMAKAKKSSEEWPFYAQKPLTQAEQILYWRLVKSLPGHIVLAQVSLAALLGIKKGSANRRSLKNRIDRKVVDFAVCLKDSSVVAVVELDDATHARSDRQYADTVKDKALTAAGIRVIRWQAKTMPDEQVIRKAFEPPQAASPEFPAVMRGIRA